MEKQSYKSKFTKTFRKYLLSYIFILLLPLISGLISYYISISVAKTSSIENNSMLLEQSKNILDQRMREVERFTRQIAINYDLTSLLYEDLSTKSYNVVSLSKTLRDISNYAYTNDFLQDFYIYLKNYDVIIKPGSVFYRVNHFYELHQYPNVSLEEWKNTILEGNHQRTVLPLTPYNISNKESSVITYLQSLPLKAFNDPKGVAVVTIDHKKIVDLLGGISNKYGGWAYISDPEGNTIALVGADESDIMKMNLESMLDKQESSSLIRDDTLLITTRSEYNGWFYTAGIPKQVLMEKANVIKETTWIVTASTIFIGFFICLFLAYKNSLPMTRVLKTLRDQFGGHDVNKSTKEDDYDFIQGNIARLISNHKLLQEELNKQIPILRDSFMKSLIHGEFNSLTIMQAAAAQANLEIKGNFGFVAIIKIGSNSGTGSKEVNDELNTIRLVIKQTLLDMDRNLKMTDIDFDKICILFNFSQEPEALILSTIEKSINLLSESIRENNKISLTTSMGSLYRNLLDISRSYNEASETIDYSFLCNEKSIYWYDFMKKDTENMYYYPIDVEIRFLNAIKNGEEEEAKRILTQIFEQNFGLRDLSIDMAQQFILEVKATVLKAVDFKSFQNTPVTEEIKNKVTSIQLSDGIEQVKNTLNNVISSFCIFIANRKIEADNDTIKKVINYIEENYDDPNLSLNLVSEQVDRPEKYISQIFKEQTGEYYAEYIEKIRMNKASELLVNTNKTIEEVSQLVGYNSPHSFRRAFKRSTDVTPNMYRKTIKHKYPS